jgi:tetratricopeptide (TPR) repeat protein
MACAQGDHEKARTLLQEGEAVAREGNDKPGTVNALVSLARVAQALEEHEKARALLAEAEALDAENVDAVQMQWGHLLLEMGDYTAARSRYERGLALRRERGDAGGIACALLEAGHAAWLKGESRITQSHAIEALGLFRARNARDGVLAALENLGMVALAQGQKARAARLLGAAEALREALGLHGPDWWRRPRERVGEAVRGASLKEAFAAAWAEGRAMRLEEAGRYASEEPTAGGHPKGDGGSKP